MCVKYIDTPEYHGCWLILDIVVKIINTLKKIRQKKRKVRVYIYSF